jgi:hypothetical protein
MTDPDQFGRVEIADADFVGHQLVQQRLQQVITQFRPMVYTVILACVGDHVNCSANPATLIAVSQRVILRPIPAGNRKEAAAKKNAIRRDHSALSGN